MAEHGVEFVQFASAPAQLLDRHASCFGQFLELGIAVRQEFVQRRVEQADSAWQTRHHFKDGHEVAALFRQQLVERGTAALFGIGEDHFAHGADPAGIEEHVLGPAKADAFGAELARHAAFGFGFGIGAHAHAAVPVGPFHQGTEIASKFGFDGGDLARHDLTIRAVDGDDIPFGKFAIADAQRAPFPCDRDLRSARYARTTHSACNHSRMAGHPAACRQNPGCRVHSVNIFRRGFNTNQNDLLAAICPKFGRIRIENDLAACGTRRCRKAGCQNITRSIGIKRWVQQLVERHRIDTQDGGLLVDQPLIHHVDGHLQRGLCRPLAVTRLEKPELALLHGEFDILHVGVMPFQQIEQMRQFGKCFGHGFFHARLVCPGGFTTRPGEILRRADARDHIFALRIDQPFAVVSFFTGRRIARECNTRSAGIAHVAEYHRLHVHRSAHVMRNIVQAAIDLGALGIPAVEDGADCAP